MVLCNSVPVEVPHLAPHGIVHPHYAAAATIVFEAIFAKPCSLRRRGRPLDANKGNLVEGKTSDYVIIVIDLVS